MDLILYVFWSVVTERILLKSHLEAIKINEILFVFWPPRAVGQSISQFAVMGLFLLSTTFIANKPDLYEMRPCYLILFHDVKTNLLPLSAMTADINSK